MTQNPNQTPNPLLDALRQVVADVTGDAVTAAAMAAGKQRLHQVLDDAVDKAIDATLEAAATVASMASEFSAEHREEFDQARATWARATGAEASRAPRQQPAKPAAETAEAVPADPGGAPVDVSALRPGDEVLIRATVVDVLGPESVRVELFSKTDQYQAWVRGDLIAARQYTAPELVEGAQYAAQRPAEREAHWLYLPREAGDERPFVTLAGPRGGRRAARADLPEHLVEIASEDNVGL